MASNIHQVFLTGRLGGDPELKRVGSNNTKMAEFSLAFNQWKGPNRDEETGWIDCVMWGNRAKVGKYLNKGDLVAVFGELQIGTYKDRDGNKRKSVQVNVQGLELPDKNSSSSGSSWDDDEEDDEFDELDLDDDDLPF